MGPRGALPVAALSDAPAFAAYEPAVEAALAELVARPEIGLVVVTTATRSLFRLANDHSIEDLPASGNDALAFDGLDHFVGVLVQAGKKIVLTVDNPSFNDPKKCIGRISAWAALDQAIGVASRREGCAISYVRQRDLSKKYRDLLERVRDHYVGKVAIFDSLEDLCDIGNDLCASSRDGRLLYSYSDHISDYAASRLAARLIPFAQSFSEALPAARPGYPD